MNVCVSERSGNHLIGFLIEGRQLYIYSGGEPVGFGVGSPHSSNNTSHREVSGQQVMPGVQNHWHHSSPAPPTPAHCRLQQHNTLTVSTYIYHQGLRSKSTGLYTQLQRTVLNRSIIWTIKFQELVKNDPEAQHGIFTELVLSD